MRDERKLTRWLGLLAGLGLMGLTCISRGASAGLDLARQLNDAFSQVAENASGSVVVISVVQRPAGAAGDADASDGGDSMPREFWRFFRRPGEPLIPEPTRGKGSGVIIREDGYILTNGHVVEDAQSIQVRLKDGRSFPAKVRGIDAKSDVAVVKIDAKGLPVAKLGDSDKTRVGEFAIVIGAPFDLDYSVTFGHVSAKGRSNILQGYEAASMDQDYLQTDALMNPGNSGGPLLNLDGEVIGINTLIRGMHSGIGFAIPSNLAREISDQLVAKGKFTRAWLGIAIRGLRDGPPGGEPIRGVEEGVIVEGIVPEGPAAKSELQKGDVITAVAGRKVRSPKELRAEIRGKAIGQPVALGVFRTDLTGHGKAMEVEVKPAEWLEAKPVMARAERGPEERLETGFGLAVHPLTPELAKKLGAASAQGVVVIAVEEKSPAARGGILPGDIVLSIDQQKIGTPKDFRQAVKAGDLKKGVAVSVFSEKKQRVLVLKEGKE